MIYLKQSDRGSWLICHAETTFDGKIVLGSFIGDVDRVSDLPEVLEAVVREEVLANLSQGGIDPDTGFPAESVAADAGEEFLMPGGPDDREAMDPLDAWSRAKWSPGAKPEAEPQRVARRLRQNDLDLPF